MGVDEFTEIEDAGVFEDYLVEEKEEGFVVKGGFFEGMAKSSLGMRQRKRVFLFEDKNFTSYQAISLGRGKYLVLRRPATSVKSTGECLSIDNFTEVDRSVPEEELNPVDWKPSDTDEMLRDLYESGRDSEEKEEDDDDF